MGRNGLGHFRGRNRESTGWFCGHNSLQPSSALLLARTERAGRGLTFTSQQSTLRRHGRDRDQNQCRAPGRAAPVSAVLLQKAAPAPQTTAPGWSHRWETSPPLWRQPAPHSSPFNGFPAPAVFGKPAAPLLGNAAGLQVFYRH